LAVNGVGAVGMHPSFWRLASATAQNDISVVTGISWSVPGTVVVVATLLHDMISITSIKDIDFTMIYHNMEI
jgi:hypothetical protein